MLGDPENLRFGILRAHRGKIWDRGIQRVAGIVGLPSVPWQPAHSLRYSLPPAIKFSSVGATGFAISGTRRRTEACTAEDIIDCSQRDGGTSARTSARPSFK